MGNPVRGRDLGRHPGRASDNVAAPRGNCRRKRAAGRTLLVVCRPEAGRSRDLGGADAQRHRHRGLMRWIVLAGEYPPVIGGVAQHTYGVVAELSRRGHAVSVISGLQERWTSRGLPKLSALIDREPRPRRLLVPYAPNVFGCRGMNFAICGWLQERSRTGDEIHLIVHEPFYPWRLVDKPSRWILAAAQRHMMRRLLGASTRVYVSTSAWEPMVRSVASRSIAIEQLP